MIQPNFSNSKSDRKSKKFSKIYDQLFAGGIVSFFYWSTPGFTDQIKNISNLRLRYRSIYYTLAQ